MLKEKTQGNLTEEEQKFIESVLTDLKWRFVKAAK
jgi:DNA replication initiation complex subunit (GINS family)